MTALAALLLLAAAAPAPSAAPPEVVVIGRRVEEAKAALAACLARACPPTDDMAAATRLAVAQFLAGNYDGARRTSGSVVGQNGRYRRELPVPVSDLYGLGGALALLTGYMDRGRIRTVAAMDALRHGLPRDDSRIMAATLTVADVLARQGEFYPAVDLYDALAKQGAAARQPDIEGRAMFGAAMLYATAATINPAYEVAARRRVAALAATYDPALARYRTRTVALRGRLASMQGHRRELAAVLAETATLRATEALLVYSPPIDVPGLIRFAGGVRVLLVSD